MKRGKLTFLVQTALSAAILCVCAWITVPFTVPFTLQTFGIFVITGLFGFQVGALAVGCYLALGALGLPVFAGGGAGIGVLFGATGGYLWGFLLIPFVMGLFRFLGRGRRLFLPLGMVAGLLVCYLFGSVFFAAVYAARGTAMSFGGILMLCVVPYLLPDAAKIALATLLVLRIGKARQK